MVGVGSELGLDLWLKIGCVSGLDFWLDIGSVSGFLRFRKKYGWCKVRVRVTLKVGGTICVTV